MLSLPEGRAPFYLRPFPLLRSVPIAAGQERSATAGLRLGGLQFGLVDSFANGPNLFVSKLNRGGFRVGNRLVGIASAD